MAQLDALKKWAAEGGRQWPGRHVKIKGDETMVKKGKQAKLLTPPFRVSFPAVWDPFPKQPGEENKKDKWGVTMLFPEETDLSALKAALKEAGVAKWGPDQSKWPSPLKLPFRKGVDKDYDGYEGMVFAAASSTVPPGIVDSGSDTRKPQEIINHSEFYAGCWARATVNPYTWTYMGKNGISFGLQHLQKVKDGDAFSARGKAENDFGSLPMPESGKGDETGAGDPNDIMG